MFVGSINNTLFQFHIEIIETFYIKIFYFWYIFILLLNRNNSLTSVNYMIHVLVTRKHGRCLLYVSV
jgi:hypothetical protein